jgi:hypothetical protein
MDIAAYFPDAVVDEGRVDNELKGLFLSKLEVTHASVGDNPQFTIRLKGGAEGRGPIKEVLSRMSQREIAEMSLSFSGTLVNFSGGKVDRVVGNLQSSAGRALKEAGRLQFSGSSARAASNDGVLLSNVSPATRVQFNLSGRMLDSLRRGKSLTYSALRALKSPRDESFR